MSRYQMQLYGFLALSVVFMVVSVCMEFWPKPSPTSQLIVLGLVFFGLNSGPNLTTYILPAEIFPTCVRATCHGISAASGKIGAFLGTAAFPLVQRYYGMTAVYAACGASSASQEIMRLSDILRSGLAAALGVLVTYFLTPRQVLELETLDKEPL
eukprot:g1138.t1